jgi:hypothetical protein
VGDWFLGPDGSCGTLVFESLGGHPPWLSPLLSAETQRSPVITDSLPRALEPLFTHVYTQRRTHPDPQWRLSVLEMKSTRLVMIFKVL